jgi:uncharacterized protein
MAAKGNPSALHFVFAKPALSTTWWDQVLEGRNLFASKMHLNPFLKFAEDQMERLCGRKGQKNIHRAALEEAHRYDTKYAMHAIRLYLEAKEYIQTGNITLPNPRVDLLVAIRNGKYKKSEIETMRMELHTEAIAAQATSPLPETVDIEAVSSLITRIYLGFWNSTR